MKNILIASGLLMLFSCNDKLSIKFSGSGTDSTAATSPYSTEGKTVIVYTTADSSNHRLTVTDTLTFKDFGQPKETQICVFVDPAKKFQTFVGIGGALTDASAETWWHKP